MRREVIDVYSYYPNSCPAKWTIELTGKGGGRDAGGEGNCPARFRRQRGRDRTAATYIRAEQNSICMSCPHFVRSTYEGRDEDCRQASGPDCKRSPRCRSHACPRFTEAGDLYRWQGAGATIVAERYRSYFWTHTPLERDSGRR